MSKHFYWYDPSHFQLNVTQYRHHEVQLSDKSAVKFQPAFLPYDKYTGQPLPLQFITMSMSIQTARNGLTWHAENDV